MTIHMVIKPTAFFVLQFFCVDCSRSNFVGFFLFFFLFPFVEVLFLKVKNK